MFSSTPCYEHINTATILINKSQVEFKSWIEESKSYLLKQKKLRILDSQEIQDKISHLTERIGEYENTLKKTELSNAQQKELDRIQKDIDSLKATSAQKLKQKEEKNEKLKENEYLVKQKTEEVTSKETNVNKHLEKLEKGLKYFEEYLGLKVYTSPENCLTFTFTKILKDDPDREFVFDLAVQGSPGKYTVTNCSVQVEELEIYLRELNEHNDLKMFICKIRNCFKKHSMKS